MDSTLFIVGSPFQCLCMLEAIQHFNITSYDVLIPAKGTGRTTQQVKNLLSDKGIVYQTYGIVHAIKDFIPYFVRKHKHYQNIFVGDYYDPTAEAMACFFGKRGFNLFFLDDGTQALMLFSEHPRYRYSDKKWELMFKLYFFVGWFKRQSKPNFFTIYDVYSKKFNIIRNEFTLFKNSALKELRRDCYIIGTNSSILRFRDNNYLELLDKILTYLTERFPNEAIYYCPHRRDLNNDEIRDWCKQNDVKWFETRISVEYDFSISGVHPSCVVGFTSNALYTLKLICPDSNILTVYYHIFPQLDDEETSVIREGLNEKGIETLYLK